MKEKKLLYYFLFVVSCLSALTCKHNLTGIDLSENNYGAWQLLRESNNNGYYYDLFFVDKNNGWATGESGKIIHTIDGGISWEYQQTPLSILIYSVCFINKDIGWACSENKIIKTTNGGENWNIAFVDTVRSKFGTTDSSYKYYQQVYFKDELNGWAVNESGELIHSSDGGYNWIKQAEWEFGGPAYISFGDYNNGFVYCPGNNLLISLDGGNSWTSKNLDSIGYVNNIKFVSKNNGWIITSNMYSDAVFTGSPVYHTTNGGINWISKAKIDDPLLTSITFTSIDNGWITGSKGIYQTIDGGNTWKADEISDENGWFQKVFSVDEQNIWAMDFNGRIFKYIPN